VKAFVCGGDGGSEAGRAGANDEDIRLRCRGAQWHGKSGVL